MTRSPKTGGSLHGARAGRLSAAMLVAVVAGFGVAALTGLAIAKSFTLGVSKNAKVTNTSGATKQENVVSLRGISVYTLSGDSMSHQECTKANGCFDAWPPATVPSKNTKLSAAPGVKGKLRVWHRGAIFQLTLDNHPLYEFSGDLPQKGVANGEGIVHFGGTWHVVKASLAASKGANTTSTSGMTTTTMTMTSSTYSYPGYPSY